MVVFTGFILSYDSVLRNYGYDIDTLKQKRPMIGYDEIRAGEQGVLSAGSICVSHNVMKNIRIPYFVKKIWELTKKVLAQLGAET